MYFEERIYSILEKIKKEGRVKVAELAEIFNVSEVTIRKDLSELEEMGYLKRTFGGAILTQEHVKELSVEQKKIDNIEKKEIIAKKSAEFLKDGLDIFLDAGTTALYIAHEIIKFNNITVITYDLEIASFLSKYDNIKTYMIGGFIDTKNKLALSIDGYKSLQRMHTDLAFIGTDAFDMNYVYSTNDLKSQLKKIMSLNSKTRILTTDSSKFMKNGLFKINTISEFDEIISDDSNKMLNDFIKKRKEEK